MQTIPDVIWSRANYEYVIISDYDNIDAHHVLSVATKHTCSFHFVQLEAKIVEISQLKSVSWDTCMYVQCSFHLCGMCHAHLQETKWLTPVFMCFLHWPSRRIYRGVDNLYLFRHCPSKIFWNCTIWNINIQYKKDWYTLQKWTKPVFAFRHWDILVT